MDKTQNVHAVQRVRGVGRRDLLDDDSIQRRQVDLAEKDLARVHVHPHLRHVDEEPEPGAPRHGVHQSLG